MHRHCGANQLVGIHKLTREGVNEILPEIYVCLIDHYNLRDADSEEGTRRRILGSANADLIKLLNEQCLLSVFNPKITV